MADFRQFYGLDLPVMPGEMPKDTARYSVLWTNLPADSRVARRISPDAEIGYVGQMLRRIELDIRQYAWGSADKKNRGPEPKPIPSPADIVTRERKTARSLSTKDDIARRLGIDPERI